MIFKSSEIRWFSKDKNTLWELYEALPEKGEGVRESDRTDYYLRSGTIHTGIKIREGNHELKVKRADDEQFKNGVMEHWMKWSTSEEENILNTVDHKLLEDWVAVQKKRWKKSYKIINLNNIEMIREGFPPEGCGVEFTEIQLQRLKEPLYTIGLEAFSSTGKEKENLNALINYLDIDFSMLSKMDSYGYPQLLHGLGGSPE